MDKIEFEKDLCILLEKYGYKSDGIQKVEIICEILELPIINIKYKFLNSEEK